MTFLVSRRECWQGRWAGAPAPSFLRRDALPEVPVPALSWVPTGHLGTTEETSAI